MLKSIEVILRLDGMIGKVLNKSNLEDVLFFDKPKAKGKGNVIYSIIKTSEGYWAKINISGNSDQFRVELEETEDGNFIVTKVINTIGANWLDILIYQRKDEEGKPMTAYKLAKKSGLQESTISRIISGERKKITLETIEKLAAGLEMSIGELAEYISDNK